MASEDLLWNQKGTRAGPVGVACVFSFFTFIISPENKDPVTRHDFKFIVFGWAGHLDGSQWDHSFRVDVLKQSR